MESRALEPMERQLIDRVVGYLNFSSGVRDPLFFSGINDLFAAVTIDNSLADRASADRASADRASADRAAWEQLLGLLASQMPRLQKSSSTFSDIAQAQRVLQLLQHDLLPAYREFHADLLFHQRKTSLFRPYFLCRACEAILQSDLATTDDNTVVEQALHRLNDFIGYRPVAAFESRRHEPYPHEWVCPLPLYIEGAGVEWGDEQEVVAMAIDILSATEPHILSAAHFHPELLEELAIDPRAYDFDHPVNKRPNYHFGQWDPHRIDNQGFYRRFVVQQVTLQALMARVEEVQDVPTSELRFEAASVLAGTMLMGSGISGSGPDTHDSSVTLSSLLPSVAAYRDAFYEQLLADAAPDHRKRLEAEAVQRRQPFGGARQHLNAWLARRRASQLEHVQLAKIFARMGYPDASARQATVVPVASARVRCEIDCRLTGGTQAVAQGKPDEAMRSAEEIVERLNRAIACGAVIDPWNILGFDAHFSLFPALENSVHDHRADELIELVEELFSLLSRIWSAAAAEDNDELCQSVRSRFHETATWWRQFAAHEVSSVDAVDPLEVFQAAEHVAESLNLWHKGGAASGDVRFWAPHAHMFDSPRAFALVIEALLERDDFVASMALLIRWLSQAEQVPLERADISFYQLAERWLVQLLRMVRAGRTAELPDSPWNLMRKFFDFLEANAEEYWLVPRFELGAMPTGEPEDSELEDEDDDDEEDHLYSAAYDDMVYRDSTNDGVESELYETDESTTDELTRESERIADRVAFLISLARLWKLAAVGQRLCETKHVDDAAATVDCMVTMRHWIQQAIANHRQLIELLETVRAYEIRTLGTDPESLQQYDRQRLLKDSLLERIACTCVDNSATGQVMLASCAAYGNGHAEEILQLSAEYGDEATVMVQVMAAIMCGDNARVEQLWPELSHALADKALLYVPLSKEGNTRQIIAARCRQSQMRDLLAWLPRRGLWYETCQLIDTARCMERNNPVGPGAVTEFDELFKVGYRALVENLVYSARSWQELDEGETPDDALAAALEEMTEVLLPTWLNHSRTLRLSVLERLHDEQLWSQVVQFIQRYGGELFTQRFLSLGNVRAILHQGVGNWFDRLEEEGTCELTLLSELDHVFPRESAEDYLSLILEAIVENYGEYRDYNSTTTQSDRGEMLYMLLDFLRLRTQYDRVCWHLKPVIWAHEILVSRRRGKAAKLWRHALTERISEQAELYLERLKNMQQTYAIRMSTVADRLAERFVRPMVIDRLRALVRPAIEEAVRPGTKPTFKLLEHETGALAQKSTGIGFDLPVWLLALDEEVDRVREPSHHCNFDREIAAAVESVALSRQAVQDTLENCSDN